MRELIEKLVLEAEEQQRIAHMQSDITAKHFFGGKVLAFKEVLKLLSEEG